MKTVYGPVSDPFSGQSSPENQLTLDTVEGVCPSCHKTPEATEKEGSTITLRPCGHTFRRSDLVKIIDHLRALDELIQRHDAATTPFERQGIREEIHVVGTKLDANVKRCTVHRDSSQMD
jgi:hypothetical protein